MFDRKKLDHAVDLQRRSFGLLKWLAEGVRNGLVQPNTAHAFLSQPDAASDWLSEHLQNVPPETRPSQADIPAFANFFCTYVENSFVLHANPGKQLYSPDAHCFCPLCSWLVDAPSLTTRKVKLVHKKRANRMRVDALASMAAELGLAIPEPGLSNMLEDHQSFENASLLAYGYDLFRRMEGIANGPAVLALWRGFAWNRSGSPRKGFRFSATLVVNAEADVMAMLKQHDSSES